MKNEKNPEENRRLCGVDAAFLYLERKQIPLHIASVAIFDGPIPYEEFVATIDSKLHLIPRYRQVVSAPALNLTYPTWEDDPAFDIRRHIFPARLAPPGGEAELEALAGRILSQLMDRSKPLWDIHVVEGLKNGRGALIARVHHALADGISGAALLKVMLDPTPEGSHAIGPPRYKARRRRAAPAPPLTDIIRDAAYTTAQNVIAAERGLLGMAEALLGGRLQSGMDGLKQVFPEFAASIERLPFNRPCTGERKFCWSEASFADLQAIRAAGGGTVNDVILTAVTRGIARYVKLHGETVARRFVRVVCPVSLRRGDDGGQLGNRITFLPVALPLSIRDPMRNLKAVSVRTEIMKQAGAAEMVALAAACIAAAPPPLQALFWAGLPEIFFPVPILNVICTNVPGSPTPLYAVGRRMLTSYPQVPTGYELGVGIAAQSYDGKVFFGFTSDTHAAPDADRLRDCVRESFEELCHAAGARRPKPRARKAASSGPAAKPEAEAARPAEAAGLNLAAEGQAQAYPSPLAMSAKPGA
jgi:diacylglycerol O-acyltransferase / wax synthase